MKNLFIFILVFSLLGWNNKSELEKKFDCNATLDYLEFESITDFNKNFQITVPKEFETQLFYNNYQSSILTSNSTKEKPLSILDSYIVEVNYNTGELDLNKEFIIGLIEKLQFEENLTVMNKSKIKFKGKEAYWLESNRISGKYPYNEFTLLVKESLTSYYEIIIKIYGDNNKQERLCESFAIIKSIKDK